MINSRVKILRNLVFVGSKRTILLCVEQLFSKPNLQEQHVFNLLKILTDKKQPSILHLNNYSYIPFNLDIPSTQHGFVYLLISLSSPNLNTFYVGQTSRKLLTRQGSSFKSPVHRQRWAIAALMHNFPSDSQRLRTESFVQRKFNQQKPNTLIDALSILKVVVNSTSHKGIILSICGKVSTR